MQQGRARPWSLLALCGMTEEIKSGSLSLSGVEKRREAPRKNSRIWICVGTERRTTDYREQLKSAPLIHALYPP